MATKNEQALAFFAANGVTDPTPAMLRAHEWDPTETFQNTLGLTITPATDAEGQEFQDAVAKAIEEARKNGSLSKVIGYFTTIVKIGMKFV